MKANSLKQTIPAARVIMQPTFSRSVPIWSMQNKYRKIQSIDLNNCCFKAKTS
ncbi:hypothetical protein LLB_3679 [Legionella longbeachae D-4968]|nr:hypothetical protein LLB_3679 [Legionella longbeachae D-4968]